MNVKCTACYEWSHRFSLRGCVIFYITLVFATDRESADKGTAGKTYHLLILRGEKNWDVKVQLLILVSCITHLKDKSSVILSFFGLLPLRTFANTALNKIILLASTPFITCVWFAN